MLVNSTAVCWDGGGWNCMGMGAAPPYPLKSSSPPSCASQPFRDWIPLRSLSYTPMSCEDPLISGDVCVEPRCESGTGAVGTGAREPQAAGPGAFFFFPRCFHHSMSFGPSTWWCDRFRQSSHHDEFQRRPNQEKATQGHSSNPLGWRPTSLHDDSMFITGVH